MLCVSDKGKKIFVFGVEQPHLTTLLIYDGGKASSL